MGAVVGAVAAVVGVGFAVGDATGAGDVGVLQRIDIDGGAVGVVGPFGAAGDGTAVKRRGVVVVDRDRVVAAVGADEFHCFDGIAAAIEFTENGRDFIRDIAMDDHFAGVVTSVKAPIGHPQVPQIIQPHRTAPMPGVAADHSLFDRRGDGGDGGMVAGQKEPGGKEEGKCFFHRKDSSKIVLTNRNIY